MAYLKPPFRAESMEGLYKRVVKGLYQRLPGHYSVDLNDFLGYFLSVNPKSRYSSTDLLSLPSVIERIKTGVNLKESIEENRVNLLQTIRVPNNLQYLTDKLPKANYEPLKMGNLPNVEGYSSYIAKSEESVVRNKSAASRANRSVIHEQSQVNSSQLADATPLKKRNLNQGSLGGVHGDSIIKERINKQHEKVEQQIKKYDEILKRNKNARQQYDLKKKINSILYNENGNPHNNRHHDRSIDRGGKDLIKINGVKLEHRSDHRPRNKPADNSSRLPALKNASSVPKGLGNRDKYSGQQNIHHNY